MIWCDLIWCDLVWSDLICVMCVRISRGRRACVRRVNNFVDFLANGRGRKRKNTMWSRCCNGNVDQIHPHPAPVGADSTRFVLPGSTHQHRHTLLLYAYGKTQAQNFRDVLLRTLRIYWRWLICWDAKYTSPLCSGYEYFFPKTTDKTEHTHDLRGAFACVFPYYART